MQTFNLRPATFRPASAPNDKADFSSERPARADEQFDELMNRALAGNPRPLNPDDGNARQENSTAASRSKPADKSKKPLSREAARNNDVAPEPRAVANPSAPHPSQTVDAQTTADDDDGASEDESDAGQEKDKPASKVGKSDGTPIGSTLLMVAGSEAEAASPATPIPTGKQSVTPRETPVNRTEQSSAQHKPAEISNTAPDASPQTEALDAAADSNSTSAVAKDSGCSDEKVLSAGDAVGKAPAESKPPSGKTVTADALPVPPSDLGGTSAAKHYVTMKKMEKTPKVAGSTEQDLPSDPAMAGEELPTMQKSSAHALLQGSEKAGEALTVDSSAAAQISTAPEAPALTATPITTALPGVESRLRVLERTHDIVALHAMRLSQTASDSLHVVVKPGGGIQLSLELRQGDGFVEVRASLHKGNFAHMSQHWPDLQQRLEARGVRVGTLDRSENFTDTGSSSFQQSQQQQTPDQDPLHAGAFAEFALAGSLREAPAIRAARATAYRGWETWA